MTTERDRFLQRVRRAVADGNRAGGAPALPSRGNVGYQARGPIPSPASAPNAPPRGGSCISSPTRPPPRTPS